MQVREWLNENQPIVAGVVILILLISLVRIGCVMFSGPSYGPGISNLYYYDLNTGELFSGPIRAMPPIQAPSDSPGQESGVRAFVFSCEDCRPDTYQIGYLQRGSQRAKEAYRKIQDDPDSEEAMMLMTPEALDDLWVRRPEEGSQWHSQMDNRGQEIMNAAYSIQCPDGTIARECFPNR